MTEHSRSVFLSYASDDFRAAQRIEAALREAGIEVWFDQQELRGGDVWDQKIRHQIRDCALFIPLVSANTQARPEGYFRLEWRLADQRTHLMGRGRTFLVPVCLDGTREVDADAPDSFLAVQWTRLTAEESLKAFVARVVALLATDQSHAPAPAHPNLALASADSIRAPDTARRWRPAVLLITVAVIGASYFAIDKFVLSKRAAAAGPATPVQVTAPEKSIAVLPFVDMSEKKDQEYLADGMAEEILNLLVKIPELKVIGRTSSFSFKGKADDLRAIGATLGAEYVLEGSVRRVGDHIRVTAQLIDARDGSHRWSQTFDRTTTDILRLQEEIAVNIGHSLNLTISAAMRPGAMTSPLAYDYYLRGLHDVEEDSKDGLQSALANFGKALALDPKFSQAAVGIAQAWLSICAESFDDPKIACENTRAAVSDALRLDPQSADAYAIRAEIRTIYDWDWEGAASDVKKSESLGGGDFTSFAAARIAYTLGDMARATQLLESIMAHNPVDPFAQTDMGFFVALRSGRYAEAEAFVRRAMEITPDYSYGAWSLGITLLMQGKLDEALASMKRETSPAARLQGSALVYYALGRKADSDAALKLAITQAGEYHQSEVARAHAFRGELEQAMDCLDKAYVSRDVDLYYIKGDPLLKKLAGYPRYQAFLRKMKLAQ